MKIKDTLRRQYKRRKVMINISHDKCIGCRLCVMDCPVSDIELIDLKATPKNERCFNCGHCIAICPVEAIASKDYDMSEVKKYDKETFGLDADHLMNAIKFRRSVRQFKPQAVEKEKIEKIIEAGRFTQTATNAQNVSYIVVTEKIDQLREATFETLKAMGTHMINDPNTDPKLLGYAHMWLQMYEAYKADSKNDRVFFNAPAVILTVSPHVINATLASSNMELMTNALGLGTFFSGFFTLAAEKNPALKAMLGVGEGENIVTCMVMGYPGVKYQRTTPRKEAEVKWM